MLSPFENENTNDVPVPDISSRNQSNYNYNKEILRITLPSILSNITVPLLSFVDLSIVGHWGNGIYIGAISIGSTLFNMIYWIFAFLRMGTTGLTSQAFGRKDYNETYAILIRATGVAYMIALLILILQIPLREIAFKILSPPQAVGTHATTYYNIVIWGVPAVLCQYACTGWLIGMQEAKYPLYIALLQNVVNIVFSFLLVYAFHWEMKGVASGTVIAQYAGLFLSYRLCRKLRNQYTTYTRLHLHQLFSPDTIKRFFQINRDIFLRTLCLVAVTVYFTSFGARQGDTILAVNTLLMQFFMVYSFFMDGLAFAGEALSGRFAGADDRVSLRAVISRLFVWGSVLAILFTLAYAFGSRSVISLLTNDTGIIDAASPYLIWVIFIPLTGMAAFVWDGVFIGLTATRQMLIAMFGGAVIFFGVHHCLYPIWSNNGLWIAFLSYLFVRGIAETMLYRKVRQRLI